jgi:hypothetical protein
VTDQEERREAIAAYGRALWRLKGDLSTAARDEWLGAWEKLEEISVKDIDPDFVASIKRVTNLR